MAARALVRRELHVARELLHIATPTFLSNSLIQAQGLITILWVGSFNDPYMLGSVGLGQMAQNVFGFSLGIGINSALETLVSQSHGAGRHKLSGHYLQQAQVLSLAISVPCCFGLIFAGQAFAAVGVNPRTAKDAGAYVQGVIPSLPFYFLYDATRTMLRSVKVTRPDFYISLAVLPVEVILCWVFLSRLRWGSFGAGLAYGCSNLLHFVLLTAYVVIQRPHPTAESWHVLPWSYMRRQENGAVLRGVSDNAIVSSTSSCSSLDSSGAAPTFRKYLAVAIPSSLLLWSEWWAFEVMYLTAAMCGTVGLAAHTAVSNVLMLVYVFPGSAASAVSAMVGNAMGRNDPAEARTVIRTSSIFIFCLFTLVALAVVLLRIPLAHLFCRQAPVVRQFEILSFFLAPFCAMDAVQTVWEGVLRGMGLQKQASNVKLVSMLGVRLSFGIILALPLKVGVEGIWIGGIAGMSLTLALYLRLLRGMDVEQIATSVQQQLGLAGEGANAEIASTG